MSAAEKYASETMAAANNLMTLEQSRNVWILVSALVQEARNTEQQAWLAMAEVADKKDVASAAEFCRFTRESLKKVHEQLKAISGVLNATAKAN